MTPIAHFELVWGRCEELSVLHRYIAGNVSSVLKPDELLRAEWVMRVSALDLYIHELVAQTMVEIFEGKRPTTPGYLKFQVSNETFERVRTAKNKSDALSAFDLEIRSQLTRITYQHPDNIAEGIRLCSVVELWNELALNFGAINQNKSNEAKILKKALSLIVERRNKIAHEGDLKPVAPRESWPISQVDLAYVKNKIEKIVRAIDSLLYPT